MAFLKTETPQGLTQQFELDGDTMALGRHPDCHVVIEDSSVSRFHAQISWDGTHFFLEDLGSRNGTFLNDAKVFRPAVLQPGDLIRICDLSFGFFSTEGLDSELSHHDENKSLASLKLDKDLEKSVVWDEADRTVDGSTIMSQVAMASVLKDESSTKIGPAVKLAALMEIIRSLSGTISLKKVGPRVLDCLMEMFQSADRGFIVLSDDDRNLRPIATKTRSGGPDQQMRCSRTVFDHVMNSKLAVLSADTTADERFDASASIVDIEIQSMICAPLISNDGKVMGLLQLDSIRRTIAFREEDLELLVVVAMQAAAAIEKAHMLEVELEQQQVRRDLNLANQVQAAILPHKRPQLENVDFFDFYRSANQVGGDYFDYIDLGEDRTAIVVADVVGHGVAAALLMAKFSAEVRFAVTTKESLSEAVASLNQAMAHLQLDRFITMAIAVLNTKTLEVVVVNAGHTLPIIRRNDGSIETQDVAFSGLPVGVIPDAKYQEVTFQLCEGDWLVIYTDGLNEQLNAAGEQYGVKQLTREIELFTGSDAETLGKNIMSGVRLHSEKIRQEDDMCLVCFGAKVQVVSS